MAVEASWSTCWFQSRNADICKQVAACRTPGVPPSFLSRSARMHSPGLLHSNFTVRCEVQCFCCRLSYPLLFQISCSACWDTLSLPSTLSRTYIYLCINFRMATMEISKLQLTVLSVDWRDARCSAPSPSTTLHLRRSQLFPAPLDSTALAGSASRWTQFQTGTLHSPLPLLQYFCSMCIQQSVVWPFLWHPVIISPKCKTSPSFTRDHLRFHTT